MAWERGSAFPWPDRRPPVADFLGFGGFQTDSCPGAGALMEDQPVEIVGEIGERQFRFGPRQADGADEQAEPVLLMSEDVFDRCPDRGFAGIGARDMLRHRPSRRLAAMDAADQHLRGKPLLVRL